MIHPFWRSLLVLHTPLALPSSDGASVGALRAYVSRSRTSRVESCCRWVSCRKTLEKCLDFDRKRWCKSAGFGFFAESESRAQTRMMAVEDGFVTRQQTQIRKTSNCLLTIEFLEAFFLERTNYEQLYKLQTVRNKTNLVHKAVILETPLSLYLYTSSKFIGIAVTNQSI